MHTHRQQWHQKSSKITPMLWPISFPCPSSPPLPNLTTPQNGSIKFSIFLSWVYCFSFHFIVTRFYCFIISCDPLIVETLYWISLVYLCRTVEGYWFLHSVENQKRFSDTSFGIVISLLFLTIFMWEAKKSRTIRSRHGLLKWYDYNLL
jgi:hypothetical protein